MRRLCEGILGGLVLVTLVACGRGSSPEGRVTMKMEALQKDLVDSLQKQNRAILDSIAALRSDIRELQETK